MALICKNCNNEEYFLQEGYETREEHCNATFKIDAEGEHLETVDWGDSDYGDSLETHMDGEICCDSCESYWIYDERGMRVNPISRYTELPSKDLDNEISLLKNKLVK